MSLILSDAELEEITGYKRAADQLPALHARGFFRAFRSPTTGRVVLERAHYDAVSRATPEQMAATRQRPRLKSQRLKEEAR